MLTSEGCAAHGRRLWDSLPEPVRRPGRSPTPESLIYFANYVPRRSSSTRSNRPRPSSCAAIVRSCSATTCSGRSSIGATSTRSCALEWYTGKKSAPPPAYRCSTRLAHSYLPRSDGARIGVEIAGCGRPARPDSRPLRSRYLHPRAAAHEGRRRAGADPRIGPGGRGGPCGRAGRDRAGDDGA